MTAPMTTDAGSTVQPGWYQDPKGANLRWWDGTAWTEHVHAQAAPAPTGEAGSARSAVVPAEKAGGNSISDLLNDNPVPVLIALALVLTLVVVLFVL